MSWLTLVNKIVTPKKMKARTTQIIAFAVSDSGFESAIDNSMPMDASKIKNANTKVKIRARRRIAFGIDLKLLACSNDKTPSSMHAGP
jgi:hypothetical protein